MGYLDPLADAGEGIREAIEVMAEAGVVEGNVKGIAGTPESLVGL